MKYQFENAIEKNNKIKDENLKKVFKEVFCGVFEYLGQQGFERWLSTRKLPKRIEEFAIEIYTEEDKKKSRALGFYTVASNTIKVRPDSINKHVISHETGHFLNDTSTEDRGYDSYYFKHFLTEGITEYLNIKMLNEYKNYYVPNVKIAEFLHKYIGDSIIKTHLQNKATKNFEDEFSSYLSNNGKENDSDISRFMGNLDNVHWYIQPTKNITEASTEQEKKVIEKTVKIGKNSFIEVCKFLKNISVNVIRKKAENLEFYRAGNLNGTIIRRELDTVYQDFEGILKSFGYSKNMIEVKELKDSFYKNSFDVILSNANVCFDDTEYTDFDDFFENIYDIDKNINVQKFNWFSLKQKEVLPNLINGKMANVTKDGKFDMYKFIEEISIIRTKFDIEDEKIENVLMENLPKTVNKQLILNTYKKVAPTIFNLKTKSDENKRNVIESSFVKIDDGKYIEKRDSMYLYMTIDQDGNINSSNKGFNNVFHVDGRFMDNDLRNSINECTQEFGRPRSYGIV